MIMPASRVHRREFQLDYLEVDMGTVRLVIVAACALIIDPKGKDLKSENGLRQYFGVILHNIILHL